ncbi:hypothetical protein [Flammeovirga aprica]|uniref:Uncharacterized protein n=1 Tax=Flammeovirga aprica JL-4 TaxID=694437 RepID=A0A7X9RXJ7_9BACT|nr:hypothetical protein [Flammeovirga aprica]NME70591.1 hypothetical protein [Flammeovirga aprica JL-4]
MKNLIIITLLFTIVSITDGLMEEKSIQKSHIDIFEVEKKYIENDLSRLFQLEDYEECKNVFDSIKNNTYDLRLALTFEDDRIIPIKCTKDTLEVIVTDDRKIFHCINGKCTTYLIHSLTEYIADSSIYNR